MTFESKAESCQVFLPKKKTTTRPTEPRLRNNLNSCSRVPRPSSTGCLCSPFPLVLGDLWSRTKDRHGNTSVGLGNLPRCGRISMEFVNTHKVYLHFQETSPFRFSYVLDTTVPLVFVQLSRPRNRGGSGSKFSVRTDE